MNIHTAELLRKCNKQRERAGLPKIDYSDDLEETRLLFLIQQSNKKYWRGQAQRKAIKNGIAMKTGRWN